MMTSPRLLDDFRARHEDAPLDLVIESADWQPVVRLIDGWARDPLGPASGYSSQDLDVYERKHGVRFPPTLREWWRLAGRHPFVAPGLLPDNARLLGPDDVVLFSRRTFLAVAIDDIQTESGNGIHADFLSDPDPEIHGINTTIGPGDAPGLDWYMGEFIATGLRVPTLAFTTLLWHLFDPSPLLRGDAVYLKIEGEDLAERRRNEQRLISQLGLRRFPNATIVGDIYSDGEDVIYWWLSGCACRSAEAAERVCRIVPARRRSR